MPIAYFWMTTHLDHIRLIDEQLAELDEEKNWSDLSVLIQQHRLLVQRYFTDKSEEVLTHMQAVENQIDQKITDTDKLSLLKKHKKLLISEFSNPARIRKKWEKIQQQFPNATSRTIESLHTILLHDLVIQFEYFADRVGISYFEQINKYVMIQSIFVRLPSFQEYLAQLSLISEKILTNPSRELARDRALTLVDLLESDIAYFKDEIKLHSQYSTDEEHQHIIEILQDYLLSAEQLVQLVKTRILTGADPNISLAEFQNASKDILEKGHQLWDMGLREMTHIFETEREYILFRLWVVLLTTLFLIGFAFFLGLELTYTGIRRLMQLTQATNSFTNGNLSVRLPEIYRDEIGLQSQAFNRMAQKLEELISHLYELLDATSALANGNLTARIPMRQDDTEFDQVALSFNKMAETFETIIGRLQQIGKMLTTSASEIASASKEQETIVVEQEATTREIAIAANEISSTAKEFATTMNEVSQAAEQTSDLALRGKDSLSNMESIMRNMVDASTKIASKLAVLNEKAGNITSVITTITKVADQTNLLSLNASIEAEKAGEYGRSFAVIAREIRRLADQTAIATLDIEKMVNEIMTAVSSSVMGVDDFTQEIRKGVDQVRTVSEQLATIIERVQAFTARFELVNQGMQAQSTGAEQINEAIGQLSQTARQTSEAIHQFHKTIQELNQAANELSILNPFVRTSALGAYTPSSKDEMKENSNNPTSKESKRQFSKTISNLNVAANKLKNLNIQLRPEQHEPGTGGQD